MHYRYLGSRELGKTLRCSLSVCMQVETLGMARSLGWKAYMRCAHGPRDRMKRVRECVYRWQHARLQSRTQLPVVSPRIAADVSGFAVAAGSPYFSNR